MHSCMGAQERRTFYKRQQQKHSNKTYSTQNYTELTRAQAILNSSDQPSIDILRGGKKKNQLIWPTQELPC